MEKCAVVLFALPYSNQIYVIKNLNINEPFFCMPGLVNLAMTKPYGILKCWFTVNSIYVT